MKQIKSSVTGFILFVLVSCSALITCEVGLGSAIDTKPPAIAIASPAVDSVKAGAFTMSGTASDETSVKSVQVTFASTIDSTISYSWPATLNASAGTWSLDLNTLNSDGAFPIKDSKYAVTVVATDSANRTSQATTVYQIDNTRPTVLATSPLTYGDDRATFYYAIDIKGEVYDASTLQSVVVSLLDADGKVLDSATADGTNTWAARFDYSSSASPPLANASVAGYNIVATDAAGNQNAYYFHRSDIYPLITANTSGFKTFPSMNTIGKIDQGVLAESDNGLTGDELTTIRHGSDWSADSARSASSTTQRYGDFYFLTQESPRVQWLNIPNAGDAIGLETPIVGTILPPSDGSSITKSSVAFHLYSLATPSVVIDQTTVTLTAVGSSLNFEVLPKDASGATLGSGNYMVYMSFATNSGNTGSSSQEFIISDGVPYLSETALGGSTNPITIQSSVNSAVSMSGECLNSGKTAAATLEYSLDDGDYVAIPVASDGNWSFTLPVTSDHSFDKNAHTYILRATSGSLTASISRIIVVDTTAPVIEITSPTAGQWISDMSKALIVNGSADDGTGSGTAVVYFRAYFDTADHSTVTDYATDTAWTKASGSAAWNGSIPMTPSLHTGSYTLWVYAKDVAGNLSVESRVYNLDKDNPTLTAELKSSLATGLDGSSYDLDGAVTISGKASDDVSLAASEPLMVSDNSGKPEPVAVAADGNWTWAPAPLTDEPHSVVFTLMDSSGKTTSKTVLFKVDKTAPSVSLTNLTAGSTTQIYSLPFTVMGTVQDSTSKLYSLAYKKTGPGATVTASDGDWIAYSAGLTPGSTSYLSWSVDIADTDPSAGSFWFLAKDSAGNKSTVTEYKYAIDADNPVITETNFSASDKAYTNAATVTLAGALSDTNAIAANTSASTAAVRVTVSKVVSPYTSLSIGDSTGLTTFVKASDNKSATWSLALTGLSEDEYGIAITGKDAVGKIETINRTIVVDRTDPTVSAAPASGWKSGITRIAGTAGDTGGSGLARVEYQVVQYGGSFSAVGPWTLATNAASWYANIGTDTLAETAADKPHTVYVRSVDNAGNVSTNATIDLLVDRSTPISSIAVGSTAKGSEPSGIYLRETDFTLSGSCGDNAVTVGRVPASVVLQRKNVATGAIESHTLPNALTWSYNVSVDEAGHNDDGLYEYTILVQDVADVSSSSSVTVRLDTTPPAITVNSPAAGSFSLVNSVTLRGSVIDSGAGVNDSALSYHLEVGGPVAMSPSEFAAGVTISLPAAEGGHTLTVTSADALGNSVTTTPITFYYDKDPPKVTANGTTATIYTTAATYPLSGTLEDTNDVPAAVGVSVSDVDDSSVIYNRTETGKATWSTTVNFASDGTYVYTITGKDVAGKTTAIQRTICRDTTAPTISNVTVLPPYANGSLTVACDAADAGSGLSGVLYSVNGGASWLSFTFSSGTENAGNYTANVSFSGDGTQTLLIKATDKAGKSSTPGVADKTSQSIVIDSTAPTFSIASPDTSTIPTLNGVSDLAIVLSITETTSGVDTVEASADKTNATAWAAGKFSGQSWAAGTTTLTIPAATIAGWPSGAKSIYIRITDKAGNTSAIGTLNVFVDTSNPSVAFTSPVPVPPKDKITVNKVVTVKGTAGDNVALNTVTVDVQTSVAGWATIKKFTGPAGYNWSIPSWDTEIPKDIDGNTVTPYDCDVSPSVVQWTLRATAVDSAGNVLAATQAIIVDQDSDRPEVKLTNLDISGKGLLKNTRAVYGSISDDDGLAKTLEIALTAVTTVGSTDTVATPTVSDWNSVTLDGSSFTFTIPSAKANGKLALWFRIQDDQSASFQTVATGTSSTAVVTYGNGSATVSSLTPVVFTLDTEPPTLDSDSVEISFDGGAFLGFSSTTSFFRKGSAVSIRFRTDDAAGIDVTDDSTTTPAFTDEAFTIVKIVDKDKTAISSLVTADATTAAVTIDYKTNDALDTVDLAEGTGTLEITAFDKSGLSTTVTKTIVIDHTAPAFTHAITPTSGSRVNGAVLIEGECEDSGSGLSKLQYQLGKDANASTGTWTDLTGSSPVAWQLSLATDMYANTVSAIDISGGTGLITAAVAHSMTVGSIVYFGAETYPTGAAGGSAVTLDPAVPYYVDSVSPDGKSFTIATDVARTKRVVFSAAGKTVSFSANYASYNSASLTWALPVLFRVIDKAGNHKDVTTYTLDINPDGDRPTTEILYPLWSSNAEESDSPIGGTVRVYGTAADDDGPVNAVYMKIDVNGDGIYNDDDKITGAFARDWFANGIGQVVEKGTDSWSQTLNANGEFSPLSVSSVADSTLLTANVNPKFTDGDQVYISGVSTTGFDPNVWYFVRDVDNANKQFALATTKDGTAIESETTVTGMIVSRAKNSTINISVRAQDKTGGADSKYGIWTETKNIQFDNNVPTIGSSQALALRKNTPLGITNIVQGKSYVIASAGDSNFVALGADASVAGEFFTANVNGTGTTTGTVYEAREYVEGMYVSGDWFFCGSVEDETSVGKITVDSTNTEIVTSASVELNSDGTVPGGITWLSREDTTKRYLLAIPVSTAGKTIGTAPFKITVEDRTSGKTVYSVSLRYDNEAPPTISYSGATPVVQIDNNYKAQGAADDGTNGSGISKVELYFVRFKRGSAAEGSFYKPTPNEAAGNAGTTSAFTSVTKKTFANGSFIYPTDSNMVITVDYDGQEDATLKDADGYTEKLSPGLGTLYNWSVDINALSIPDGVIEVHYAVYDEAGNVTHGQVDTKIQNNGPEIIGFTLGTDLNGDGSIDTTAVDTDGDGVIEESEMSGEIGYYSVSGGAATTTYMMKAAPSSIIPKVDGGNGALYYSLSCPTKASGTLTKNGVLTASGIELSSADLAAIGDAVVTFTIKLWDTTAETLNGSNDANKAFPALWDLASWTSLSTQSTVSATTKLADIVSPTAAILPFLWVSETDNSLYANSRNNGHIEITSVAQGAGPDVSGAISIRGTAFDDQRLTAIWIRIAGFDFKINNAANTAVSASFNTDADTDMESVSGDYYKLATFASGKWSGTLDATSGAYVTDHWDNDGWRFSVTPASLNQKGHRVSWQLDWNSAKITNVVAKDVDVLVIAEDKRVKDDGVTAFPNASTEQRTTATAGSLTSVTALTADADYLVRTVGSTDYTSVGAAGNVSGLVFKATGAATGTGTVWPVSALTSYLKIDVVPYITKVSTDLSDLYRAKPSVFNRTAQGRYPVAAGDDFSVTGFNLGGTYKAITITDTATNPVITSLTEVVFTPAVHETSTWKANIGSAAKSGTLVYSTGTAAGTAIGSINNLSSDTAEYNIWANGINNNLLNDNVALDVWEFKDAATPKNGTIQNPTMKVSPTGRIGFSFSNAVVYFSMPGKRNGSSTIYSQTAFAQNYGWFTRNTFAWDPRGDAYGVALCPDTDAVGASAFFQFFSRQAGQPVNSLSLNDNYHNIANASRLDSTTISMNYAADGDTLGATEKGTWITDIDRIQSPAMATSMPTPGSPASGTNLVTVHIAYYDKITQQVRYRQGFVGTNPADISKTTSSGLRDIINVNYTGVSQGSAREAYVVDSYTNGSVQVVAASGVSISGALAQYTATTTNGAGQFVDIGVLDIAQAQPTVVIAWYDTINRNLVLSYNTAPTSSTPTISGGKWSSVWETNARVIDTNAGQYVKMAIDSGGNIHLAYYNNNSGDLKYAYLTNADMVAKNPAEIVTVDSYLSVGSRCTIDVAKDANGNQVPYIGYQMSAMSGTGGSARYAYRTDYSTSSVPAGVDSSDRYTGKWEIGTIPTNRTPIDDKVNIGIHKNWTGTDKGLQVAIPAAVAGTDPDVSLAETNSFPVSNSTIVHGNGTMNPVLAYSVDENGILEMAQKK